MEERLEESCVQEGMCEARKGSKVRKTKGVKTFSELARRLTSSYVFLRGQRVWAHPAPSKAIKLPSSTKGLGTLVDVCVPRDQKKKLDFSNEAESVLFMLRNKNTYPLQENKGRQKKNLMRRELHL